MGHGTCHLGTNTSNSPTGRRGHLLRKNVVHVKKRLEKGRAHPSPLHTRSQGQLSAYPGRAVMMLFRGVGLRATACGIAGARQRLASSIIKKVGPGPTTAKKSYPGAPCWSCDKVFDKR
jgi:hypothetical protein